jgi:putative protease
MSDSMPSLRVPQPPPELLAPAGDFECASAAVENGADAVYFGLNTGFNARARAANISAAELPDVMSLLHGRGARGYVTLNTLIFPNELAELEQTVRLVAAAGVDAVLVQDLGAVRLIKAICPDLPVHASTQMTLTSAESIRRIESLGVERVVLARELSLDEIRRIRRGTTMPLEVFVHGALCVAYSGQCMTSESLGGRSANRGQCAQACRLPYELVCDGRDVDLGDVQYLLSPQDLAAFDLVPELIAAGICSFKIEGRLKTPEYVANVTRHYRQAIDTALAGRPVEFTPRAVEEMELSFSRGFSHGWLDGCDHKMLVPGLCSAKHGVLVGRIRAVRGQRVEVELAGSLKRGDGIVFAGDRAQGQEQGGRVFEIFHHGRSLTERVSAGNVELAFGHGAIDLARLAPGQQIWKTDEPQLTQELRKSFHGSQPRRRLPLDLTIQAAVGQPLVIEARLAAGHGNNQARTLRCRLESPQPLVEAIRHPLSAEVLREQFGRLGGTNYELRELDAHIDGLPMLPLSVLGKLRHALVDQLNAAAAAVPRRACASGPVLEKLKQTLAADNTADRAAEEPAAALHVLCRSLSQLEAVLAAGERSTLVDFQDIREYARAVELAHRAGATILLATPRIQKPQETGIFRMLLRHGADGILARNLAGLDFFASAGLPVVADFSLNVTNELTAQYLRDLGAGRVTASYDLNRDQLLDLVAALPVEWLEVVVHQHMPMFHMEHCVFCAVLSPGTNKTNCGRPCDTHEVKLRDRIGMEHPLKADVGCRNTLYNAVPQSAAEVLPTLLERGVRHFRIELLDNGPRHEEAPRDEIAGTIALYRDLLAGRLQGQQVWRRLKAANRVGVTRGTLEERRNPLAIL